MKPKVIVQPTEEPISVPEARAHIEHQVYDDSDVDSIDSTMIEGWIAAAREYCEDFLGLSLSARTLEIALDKFPKTTDPGGVSVELPMGPVREVISITIGDGSDGEVASADFVFDDYRSPQRVVPVTAWPTVMAETNVIKIRYLAGYGVDSDGGEAMPKVIRAAMLLIIGHLFANREDSTEKAMASIPTGAEALMRPRRVLLGMA